MAEVGGVLVGSVLRTRLLIPDRIGRAGPDILCKYLLSNPWSVAELHRYKTFVELYRYPNIKVTIPG